VIPHLTDHLLSALTSLKQTGLALPDLTQLSIQVAPCKAHVAADFASNIALMLAKPLNMSPRQLAEQIIAHLPESDEVTSVAVAGPGFINFTISESQLHGVISEILEQTTQFGCTNSYAGQSIHMEFVSANPTGPLHVGHGRSAAYGACLANLLKAVGYRVHQAYYVNDAGRQMRILALSTWLRYLMALGESLDLPANAYQGDYLAPIANNLLAEHGKQFYHAYTTLKAQLPKQDPANPMTEDAEVDHWIDLMINTIGQAGFDCFQTASLTAILSEIRDDLTEFGVVYDEYFHESTLCTSGLLDESIALLTNQGHTFEKEGALWFKATAFGDEKDRVLIRQNGQPTYFASDVAYHLHKYQQGFDHIIDIFGADHHGYQQRIKGFLSALGENPDQLQIILIQFASLYRDGEKIPMSTRSGQFITLKSLRDEVGNDAARYFYIMRRPEQHLDFDLSLAQSKTQDNPVYYIQYAHARICQVLAKRHAQTNPVDLTVSLTQLALLTESHEHELLQQLMAYPRTIEKAAAQRAPHTVAHYLHQLATRFHSYYAHHPVLDANNPARTDARVCLLIACQQVFQNGLALLGVSAPETM
jgi:arginyl-tRNA synthetase